MDELQLRKFYDGINKHLSFLNDVSLNANGEDTVNLITQTINKYSHSDFIKYCVSVLSSISKNDYEFCKNLFEVICKLVKYQRDPSGHEIVYTPEFLIKMRKGDCKKFTTFICACLKCKGILSASKVVNYQPEFGWQHIYAIAFLPNRKRYVVLDPVNHEQFDVEVDHRASRVNFYDGTKGKLTMTKLSIMGNVPENQKFLGLGEAADDILGDLEDISGKRNMSRNSTFRKIHEAEQMYIHGIGDLIEGEYEGLSGLDDGIGKPKIIQKVKAKVQQAKQNVQQKTQAVKQNVQQKTQAVKQNVQQKKVERKAAAPAKKAARQEKRQKFAKKAKAVGFAPTRAAFLALIAAGGALAQHTPIKFNLAVKLAELWKKDNGKSINDIWQTFGGKREALAKAITKASNIQISGIGAASVAVVTAAAITAAPILSLVIKKLSDKGVMSPDTAALAADALEQVEDNGTTSDGNLVPSLVDAAKQASTFIEDAIKTDGGGDKPAQTIIKQTPTPNDQQTVVPPAAQTPQVFSESSSSSSQQEQQQSSNSAESASSDIPAPNAGGFLLTNASSWLTGSFTAPMMLQMHFPGHEIINGIVASSMFTVSIYLFLNKYFKTKTINT